MATPYRLNDLATVADNTSVTIECKVLQRSERHTYQDAKSNTTKFYYKAVIADASGHAIVKIHKNDDLTFMKMEVDKSVLVVDLIWKKDDVCLIATSRTRFFTSSQ